MNKELAKIVIDTVVKNNWKAFGHNGVRKFSITPTETGVTVRYQFKSGLPGLSKHHKSEIACDKTFLEALYIEKIKRVHKLEGLSITDLEAIFEINIFVMNGLQHNLIADITNDDKNEFWELCSDFFTKVESTVAEVKLKELGIA